MLYKLQSEMLMARNTREHINDDDMIEIIPKKSVGPFSFNTSISDYLGRYFPDEVEYTDEATNEMLYSYYDGSLCVYVKGNLINYISVYFDTLLYGKNIYGMNIYDFFESFKIRDSEKIIDDRLWVSNDEQQDVYEIESLGLQLWVDALNKIVAIIASEDPTN